MEQCKDPGHLYELRNHGGKGTQMLQFIKKEELDGELKTVAEGVSTEEVLMACADRLDFLFEKLPDYFTKAARWHIGQALGALQERTLERKKRGVEGTHKA